MDETKRRIMLDYFKFHIDLYMISEHDVGLC